MFKRILTRIEVAVARFVTLPVVQSAARHAAFAALAVIIASRGNVDAAVVVAAIAAAARSIQLSVKEYLAGQ